jgi:hypothetical protein
VVKKEKETIQEKKNGQKEIGEDDRINGSDAEKCK